MKYLLFLLVLLLTTPVYAVDITNLPALGTATGTDKMVCYDSSAAEGARIAGVTFSGDDGQYFSGEGGWTNISKENSLQWVYGDISALDETPFNWLRIPSDSEWQYANIKCDVAETTTPIEWDLYILDDITDVTETKLTAATSELTMSITNAYVSSIDLTGLTDPDAGAYINLRISVVADTATKCTVSIDLAGR